MKKNILFLTTMLIFGSTAKPAAPSPIDTLPNEILAHVFTFLRPSDYRKAGQVSKKWHETSNIDSLIILQLLKKNNNPQLALFDACEHGLEQSIDQLLKKGAKVDLVNKRGRTPLYIAAAYGHANVAQRLLSANAVINQPAINGYTPLHIATEKKHENLVQYLVDMNADVNCLTKNGKTALDITIDIKNKPMILCLTGHGATN